MGRTRHSLRDSFEAPFARPGRRRTFLGTPGPTPEAAVLRGRLRLRDHMALQDLTPQLRTRMGRVERWVGLFVLGAALLLLGAFAYYIAHTAHRKGWFLTKVPYFIYV